MPAEPQGCRAEAGGDEPGARKRQEQADPGRAAVHRRVPGGRVGADADEGRLAERGQAAAAGEQHEAERGERVDADVVHQGDGERAEDRRRDRHEGDGEDRDQARAAAGDAAPGVLLFLDFLVDRTFRPERLPDKDRHEGAEDEYFLE